MTQPAPVPLPLPWVVRGLAILITLVISGLGLLALINAYEPPRLTKLGYTGPLYDGAARHFGSCMILFGLVPLMLLAHSKRTALWFGITMSVLALANLFFGKMLWE